MLTSTRSTFSVARMWNVLDFSLPVRVGAKAIYIQHFVIIKVKTKLFKNILKIPAIMKSKHKQTRLSCQHKCLIKALPMSEMIPKLHKHRDETLCFQK